MARRRSVKGSPSWQGPFDVEIERHGKAYRGTYTVEGSGWGAIVHVSSQWGSPPPTQAGNQGSEATAKMLLGNFIARRFPNDPQDPQDPQE